MARPFPAAGTGAAMVTLFREDGAVDGPAMARFGRWLLDQGCAGLLVFGTTGEGPSLSVPERIAALREMIAGGIPAHLMLAGTGCAALSDTAALTTGVGELGGSALVLPPFFFRQAPKAEIQAYFDALLRQTASVRTPVYLYHFPDASGATADAEIIGALMRAHPGRITGVKDSTGDIKSAAAWTSLPGLAVFAGDDHLMRPLLRAGGAGVLTATAGLAPALVAKVYAGIRSERSEDADEARLNKLWRDVLLTAPVTEAVKLLFAELTGDARWQRMRAPLRPLDGVLAQATLARFRGLDDGAMAGAVATLPAIFS